MPQIQFPSNFFAFSQYWWFYLCFLGLIFIILTLDLGIANRNSHVISVKESLLWTLLWFILAMLFNFLFYLFAKDKAIQWYLQHSWAVPQGSSAQIMGAGEAKRFGLEFLTGYVVEKVLAIDNIFVFVVIFKYFKTPLKYQHKVLFFGILGALFFRAIFISIGAALIEYDWVFILFGGFLILTGIKLLFLPESKKELEDNFIIRFFKKNNLVSNKSYEEIQGRFFVKESHKKILMTSLFLALIIIEVSDIIFALDSVPAIFAITKEPFIVFTSNIFAILGLRSLYFLLANMVEKFEYLKYGLGVILVFVGIKMIWLDSLYGGKFPISYSLGFIFVVIIVSMLTSFMKTQKNNHKN